MSGLDPGGPGDAAGEHVPRRLEMALWLVALAIALVVRWWQPDIVPWRSDEAKAAAFAWRIAEGRDYPLLGLRTSWGFHNPPTMFYLFAPLFGVTRNPIFATMLVGLAGVGGAVLAGLTARRLFGARAGVVVLMIVGCCGNAIEHSRRLWGHDLMVPASALVLWLLIGGAGERPGRGRIAAACLAAALAQSLHLSGALLWLPIAWVVAWHRDGVLARWASVCAVLSVGVVYAPWLAGNAGSGWEDVGLLGATVAHGRAVALGHPVSPAAAWAFQLGDGLNDDMLRTLRPWEVSPAGAVSSLAANAGGVVMLAGALVFGCLAVVGAGRRAGACGALLLLASAPLVAFGVVFRASVPPYMLPGLVAMAVLAGGLFARCRAPVERFGALAVCAAVCSGGAQGAMEIRAAVREDPVIGVPTVRGLHDVAVEIAASGLVLRQGARPASVGWDDGLVTMFYSVTGRTSLPTERRPGEGMLVLVDPHQRMRPEVGVLLRRSPASAVGGYEMRRLGPGDAAAYEGLVDGPAEARAW